MLKYYYIVTDSPPFFKTTILEEEKNEIKSFLQFLKNRTQSHRQKLTINKLIRNNKLLKMFSSS